MKRTEAPPEFWCHRRSLYVCRQPQVKQVALLGRTDGGGAHALTMATSGCIPVLVGLIKPFVRQLLPNDQGHCHEVIRQSQVRCSGNSHSSGQSFVSLRIEITPFPSSWCSATNVSAVDRQAVPNAGKERPQRHKATCRCEWNLFCCFFFSGEVQARSHAVGFATSCVNACAFASQR